MVLLRAERTALVDGPIELSAITRAIVTLQCNGAPGLKGLYAEFYKRFRNQPHRFRLNVSRNTFRRLILSPFFLRGPRRFYSEKNPDEDLNCNFSHWTDKRPEEYTFARLGSFTAILFPELCSYYRHSALVHHKPHANATAMGVSV